MMSAVDSSGPVRVTHDESMTEAVKKIVIRPGSAKPAKQGMSSKKSTRPPKAN